MNFALYVNFYHIMGLMFLENLYLAVSWLISKGDRLIEV